MKKITIGFITLLCTIILYSVQTCWAERILSFGGNVSYSIASWYGPKFHGRKTASGEIFDMHKFTCAHREYPFGTWLKITNILNDKTTFCVVNDRGPLYVLRDLDLSYAAAEMIDMIMLGICVVRIENMGMDAKYINIIKNFFRNYTGTQLLQHK